MKKALIIALAAFMLLSCSTLKDSSSTVTVSGDANIKVDADIASLTIYSSVVRDSAEEARRDVSTLIGNALDILSGEFGVAREDITTSYISSSPYYEWIDGVRTLQGQSANESIEVKLKDLDKIGALFDRLSSIDGLSLSSVVLDKSDKTAEIMRAREEAVLNAYEKAKTYANSLGYEIESVIAISDSNSSYYAPRYDNARLYKEAASAASTEYYADRISISDAVTVSFSLKPMR